MKKKTKILSIVMILSMMPVLISCGNNKDTSTEKSTLSKVEKDLNIEDSAQGYLNAYIGKEVDFHKAALNKDEVQSYVGRRDYKVVSSFSNSDGKDSEILEAYREALKNVEFTIKSSTERKVTVGIKGIDISQIKKSVQTHIMKVKREKETTVEELRIEGENKAIEALKTAPVTEEKEVDLVFAKDSEGRLNLAPMSIAELENTISFFEDEYQRYEGEIPQEFKDIDK